MQGAQNLERVRRVLKISRQDWLALLSTTPRAYEQIVRGGAIPDRVLGALECMDVPVQAFLSGKLDYQALALRHLGSRGQFLPRYREAAFGRIRTAATVLDYLEDFVSWELRYDLMDEAYLDEAMIANPSTEVSISLISDFFQALNQRGYTTDDFMRMGTYSVISNLRTDLPAKFADTGSPRRLFEKFAEELVSVFERNLQYRLLALTDSGCTLEMKPYPEVLEAMKARRIGNQNTCAVRNGVIASLPYYLGLPTAEITETHCAHRGDHACIVEVDFMTQPRGYSGVA